MDTDLGLRERKKRQTRQLISDVASGLFLMRGFDNVTVAEVAEAANVSAKTVFNYFPRKEDLFLDRVPEVVELVTRAVRDRPEGRPPLAALRRLIFELLRSGHALSGIREGQQAFWQVILDSPALRARVREALEDLEALIAALLAEATGAGPGDTDAGPGDTDAGPGDADAGSRDVHGGAGSGNVGGGPGSGDVDAELAAALFLAAYRTVYVASARRMMAGECAAEVMPDHLALLERAFDAVERACPGF
ncbi:TetR/AcrR family transcriptional regulator [Sphaerisporangium sp. NPDC005289]|uniref:TetR/AcrR family transcriptional regulator n=1 Tax=Sphaerisporangium sp. NPDC005289 TaxID=3155247 RepID=UPI0033A1548C